MDLSKLPIAGSVRLRGRDVTRLESFVDASFAFSLTLLVIVFNDLPETIAELRTAMRRVPTFAACFVSSWSIITGSATTRESAMSRSTRHLRNRRLAPFDAVNESAGFSSYYYRSAA